MTKIEYQDKHKQNKRKSSQKKQVSAMPPVLEGVVSLLGPVRKKVRFPNSAVDVDGFWHLVTSGAIEIIDDAKFVYALTSDRQLQVLKVNKIPFEVINE